MLILWLMPVLPVPAQSQDRTSVEIDGRLDEPAWKLALPATDFIQRLPNTGALATEQTEARFLHKELRQVSSNLRFDLIHHPLSDLYLVYNDRRDTTNGQSIERAFIITLTNLFKF